MDESEFDRSYIPEHLKQKVHNWRNLSFSERFDLTRELSLAEWAEIGVFPIDEQRNPTSQK
jgi:hypothetical protein